MSIPDNSLPIAGLETTYDALAEALDRAGPEKSELFLVKLALLSANALADATVFQALLDAAQQDL